jgi:hypothetical protein
MTEEQNIVATLTRSCKKSAENETIGQQCILGQYPVNPSNKLNQQIYLRWKTGQNDKMNHRHCGCCHRCHLERPAVKLSMQPTSRRLWLSPWWFSSQKAWIAVPGLVFLSWVNSPSPYCHLCPRVTLIKRHCWDWENPREQSKNPGNILSVRFKLVTGMENTFSLTQVELVSQSQQHPIHWITPPWTFFSFQELSQS